MKHNFPTDVPIACTHIHNLKEGKEILHLAIDGESPIGSGTTEKLIDKAYPRFCWDDNKLTQTASNIKSKEYIWVTFEEFKSFLQGKGKCNLPFKEELKLNDNYTAVVTKEEVEVGCQGFSHEIIKKLYQLSVKAQKS